MAQDVGKIFGERLRKLREAKGLTQAQLADVLNFSRAALGYYENGRTPTIDTLDLVASFFEVPLDYLMGRTEASQKENIPICNDLGISEKSVENIKTITKSGWDMNLLLESNELKGVIELLNKIKTKIVIDLFWNTRAVQIDEIRKIFCNSNKKVLKFIQENYAESITISVNQQAKELACGAINSENSVIIWEYCLLQREMRKILDDVESDKPEYKALFAEYDNSVEEQLTELVIKKENELCDSTSSNNNELEQNIIALKQLIDFYHNHIRKE